MANICHMRCCCSSLEVSLELPRCSWAHNKENSKQAERRAHVEGNTRVEMHHTQSKEDREEASKTDKTQRGDSSKKQKIRQTRHNGAHTMGVLCCCPWSLEVSW